MTALEAIAVLRICGNHPDFMNKGCADCPYDNRCEGDKGGALLFLEVADVIEKLMRELGESNAAAE